MLSSACQQLLSVLVALSCAPGTDPGAPTAPRADGEFETLWYDGQAELNGYRWKGSRYGQMRSGEAIAIFVTETMGAKEHVKVDRPTDYRGDTLTVMKLNLVRDFQTGLYDYNTMVSAFANVNDFSPVKLSFSSAEWCGHVYEELDAGPKSVELDIKSYFQGESTRKSFPAKPAALLGDQLFLWIRGLRGAVLAPGETRRFPYLADSFERRLRHTEATWGELEIARAASTAPVSVPAGTFAGVTYRLKASDGRVGSVRIEEAYPHRLLGWTWERNGEVLDSGELTGSQRMKYWELHDEGQESLRARLGLTE